MDSFEFNKIAGAVLASMLFVMGLNLFTGAVFARPPLKMPGYDLPGASEEKPAAEAQAGPAAAPLPVLLAKADPKKGEALTKACSACHNFEKGAAAKAGPPLYGVVDRAVAEVPGFAYSDALKGKGGKWTFDALDHFIAGPKSYAAGTKMSYAGEKDPAKRADIIAYLRSLSESPAPLPQ
jgi:cytochrome c